MDRLAGTIDGRPPLIGISGSQGSGKSTLARAAAQASGAATLSLDDVYLTRSQRTQMGRSVHPLAAVRGPPGTHDLDLLDRTLAALAVARADDRTPLPAFDKRADDRRPSADWPVFQGRPRAVILEGWCLGATPQAETDRITPLNRLEAEHDPDGRWRRAVNDRLVGDYAALFARLDALVFLKAPGFDVVLDWRCEQEAELMGLPPDRLPAEERARLGEFVQVFERITRHMLAGGVQASQVVLLDRNRRPAPER